MSSKSTVVFTMEGYLLQMEKRLSAAQAELRNDLQAAQAELKKDLQAAQIQSEKRMHADFQMMISHLMYKVLFLGIGAGVTSFAICEGMK